MPLAPHSTPTLGNQQQFVTVSTTFNVLPAAIPPYRSGVVRSRRHSPIKTEHSAANSNPSDVTYSPQGAASKFTESVWSGPTFQTHLDRALEHILRGEQQCSAFFSQSHAPLARSPWNVRLTANLLRFANNVSRTPPLTLSLLCTPAGRRRWIKIGELHPTRDHGLSENLDRSQPRARDSSSLTGAKSSQMWGVRQKRRRCEPEAMGPSALHHTVQRRPEPNTCPPPCR